MSKEKNVLLCDLFEMKMKSVATPFPFFFIIIIIIYFSFCVCVCRQSIADNLIKKSLSPPSLNRTLFWFHLAFFSSSSFVFFIKFQPMMNRCRDSLFNEWLDDISAKSFFFI